MTIDTSATLEVRYSLGRMLGLALLGVVMTVFCAVLAFRLIGGVAAGSFSQFAGFVGLAFFGFSTLLILWRLARGRGAVVTLTPQGLRDTRLAADLIPWTSVGAISTWSPGPARGPGLAARLWRRWGGTGVQGLGEQRAIVLALDPRVEAGLNLGRIAGWTRGANRALGADGLCVTAAGLEIDHDRLLAAISAFHQAAVTADEGLATLFARHRDAPVGAALEAVVDRLRDAPLLLPLAAPAGEAGDLQLLLGHDNRGQKWCYLYADEATAARTLAAGTPLARMRFGDIVEMVLANGIDGGLSIHAADQDYLIPGELFDRLRSALATA
ncbi:MAG: hypothetical protein BroJett030_08910 [Alphaproteobacteria bacterium]|nr:MAG: hypothetical protein BroJett030_08910 [Alphaproteobacteria bacterium]